MWRLIALGGMPMAAGLVAAGLAPAAAAAQTREPASGAEPVAPGPEAAREALKAGDADLAPPGRYQIVRATESRVWRLDTRTGEIAVCTLEAERLVCASSRQAATPPPADYEELERRRQAEREAERQRDLAILDRILAMFRDFIHMVMQRDAEPPPDGPGPGPGSGSGSGG